ncbi:hypothetical protein IJT10_00090 [bacterium]|nr:hypothetical protein [bacterium]
MEQSKSNNLANLLGCLSYVVIFLVAVISFIFWYIATPHPKQGDTDSRALQAKYRDKDVSECFYFGRYPQKANGAIEEIKWRVLQRDSDSLLVISEMALDCKPYNKSSVAITWDDCTLRRWLNDKFFNIAFTVQEQSLIKANDLSGHADPSAEDRVFLLSIGEAKRLFTSNSERITKPTDYAVENGVCIRERATWWWLRSQGSSGNTTAVVYENGLIMVCGYEVQLDDIAVRPALRLVL